MKYIKHLSKKRFHFLDIVKNKTYYTRLNLQLQRKLMLEEEFNIHKLVFHFYLLHSNIFYENERVRKRKIPYQKEQLHSPNFFKFKKQIDKYDIKRLEKRHDKVILNYDIKKPKLIKRRPLLNNVRIKRINDIRYYMGNGNQNYRKKPPIRKKYDEKLINEWIEEDIIENIRREEI